MKRLSMVLVAVLSLSLVGCLKRDLAPLNPCVVSGVVVEVKAENVDKVDVLFMVDNSGSMTEEQTSLALQLPRMVRVLASGDIDEDGDQDFPPVSDLHLGLVSSDMGAGGYPVHCPVNSDFGDDGVLQNESSGDPGCLPAGALYPPGATGPDFLSYVPSDPPDQTESDQFAADFACIARLGTDGCGLEQQLDSVLKALVSSDSGIPFVGGTVGHGDVENEGFLRDDSLLAIIIVTDEDDCSAQDTRIFDSSEDNPYDGAPNTRCGLAWRDRPEDAHWPLDRYTNGIQALRPGSPGLVIYAAIVGVPTDLVDDPDNISFEEILDDPRMQIVPDTSTSGNGARLVVSCEDDDPDDGVERGVAYPPVRLVEAAAAFEAAGSPAVVQSICQADFRPALNVILEKIADVLGGACLPRALNRDANGLVNCEVVEVMPEGVTCEEAGDGREPEPIRRDEGRDVCRVTQQPAANEEVPDDAGWYYDDFSTDVTTRCNINETAQRISFVPGSEPQTGVTVRLECLQAVTGSGGTGSGLVIEVGTVCDGNDDCDGTAEDLICDLPSRTCQRPCDSTADCPGGFVCDDETRDVPICQSPTCQV